MSDETPQEFGSPPNWFSGPDDLVDDEERRRRRNHIENVHEGDWIIVTERGHPMIGHPIEVKGIAAPIILCYDKVHDVLHCVDVRMHSFTTADETYVQAFQDVAERKMKKVNQNLQRIQASKSGRPVSLVDIIGPPPKPPSDDEEPPQCSSPRPYDP